MVQIHSANELMAYAAELVCAITPLAKKATIMTLSGELGAGKTTFVQGIARALGVEERVTSPTFVLEKIYQLPMIDLRNQSFLRLVHIDAYRLKGVEELAALGWDELIQDPGNLVLVEWPENIESAIPKDATRLHFEIVGDGRIITMNDSTKDKN
ncbi:MAG: hypothetical protein UY70_C0024G0005 [Candidatus Kaiserbacteria bacterium GW2011_GWB1_52_6]|uniref:tRNA threonylcarbamoyladenosine biosynthesis protein TsaE n=3 Tax=Candidatus Kaiseribacteriota TaxID=1752734 RepID=A0A0G1XIV0_9BACT|nr:MAG: hypothetical protein UY67_C0003G0013 [Candidatus Kaiserbacteria bacterium GW2011_GWA2_52_12]KKW26439.1 MAG: hypothetical protein UY70_C0024G0005 [Candidatus Kaiserbacteria bacterium GW2011_GWB1_52_6]KKW30886.1 MAG: hypothetical protein UY74_C0030G0024 [Candidatus Kaiserbacteria bacterium GW2011_GWC2_52_8b]